MAVLAGMIKAKGQDKGNLERGIKKGSGIYFAEMGIPKKNANPMKA